MKYMKNLLRSLVLAGVVAGSLASANAAMIGSEWTSIGDANTDFLSRMIPGEYFNRTKLTMLGAFTDSVSGYGYNAALVGSDRVFTFSGSPTGVGGAFAAGTVLTFTFTGTSVQSPLTVTVGSSGFFGFTTDVDPAVLSIASLAFPVASPPSRLIAGLDVVVVPEATTFLAGALLLLPFAASTVRRIRRKS